MRQEQYGVKQKEKIMGLILIADNSASERQRLRKIMELDDHVVVEADNSPYCLEIIEVHRLDGALLNPFLSGTEKLELQLLQALQQRQIPAIALVKDQEKQAYQNCLDYGVCAVLGKSPSAQELQTAVAEALGLKPLPASLSAQETKQPQSEQKPSNLATFFSINSFENLVALGIEQAEESLNELTDSPIQFQTPSMETFTLQSLQERLQELFGSAIISVSQLPFSGGFAGTSQLFFLTDSADALTEALTGETPDSPDFSLAKEEMLTEVGNIVLNSIMGTMSNAITKSLEFSVPNYIEDRIEHLLNIHSLDEQSTILFAQAEFSISELNVTGDIILFFKVD